MKPHYPGGGGGGSGAVAMRHFFPVVPLTEYEVRIGAGGKGNAGNSTEGGDTYFLNATASSHVRLYGGGPGRVGNYPAFYIVSGGDGGKGFSTESGSGRPRTIVNGGSGGFSNDYVVFDNYGITDHDGYGCAGGIGSNTIFGNGGFSGWQGDGGNGFDGTGFGSGGGGGIGAVPSHLRKPITYGGNGAPGILIIEW
jgi:hypothetical protein